MSIKEMIKKVTAKEIKSTTKSVKKFEAGSSNSHMIMIAFD